MPRSRWIYRGGRVVAEFADDELVWADDYDAQADSGPLVCPDLPGYVSPVTGLWVEGRRARREDLKRTGSRPYEGREQELKEIARQREYQQKALEAKVEANTWNVWHNLPRAIQRQLMGE